MHMTESALPETTATSIAALPGVAEAKPILYVPARLEHGDMRGIVYLIGDDSGGEPVPAQRGPAAADG